MVDAVANRGIHGAVRRAIEASPEAVDELSVWEQLAERIDPAEFRPRLAPDVEVKEFKLRWGNDYAMVANPRDLLHYKLEPGEAELLPLMDGSRTVKEIVVERFRDSGDMELSGVGDLVQSLRVGTSSRRLIRTRTPSCGARWIRYPPPVRSSAASRRPS
jgi:hypothetical protein